MRALCPSVSVRAPSSSSSSLSFASAWFGFGLGFGFLLRRPCDVGGGERRSIVMRLMAAAGIVQNCMLGPCFQFPTMAGQGASRWIPIMGSALALTNEDHFFKCLTSSNAQRKKRKALFDRPPEVHLIVSRRAQKMMAFFLKMSARQAGRDVYVRIPLDLQRWVIMVASRGESMRLRLVDDRSAFQCRVLVGPTCIYACMIAGQGLNNVSRRAAADLVLSRILCAVGSFVRWRWKRWTAGGVFCGACMIFFIFLGEMSTL